MECDTGMPGAGRYVEYVLEKIDFSMKICTRVKCLTDRRARRVSKSKIQRNLFKYSKAEKTR